MSDKTKIPLIPGFVVQNVRENFNLPQNWKYVNGTTILVEKPHCDLNGEKHDKIFSTSTLYPPTSAPQLPDWLNYDRKVCDWPSPCVIRLRLGTLLSDIVFQWIFHRAIARNRRIPNACSTREDIVLFRGRHGPSKFRHWASLTTSIVVQHMQVSSLQIVEDKRKNSGISQGCIVSRRKIPCSTHVGDDHLSVLDFNVQKVVTIYDRNYTITDCDEFTRKFLARAGIFVPSSIETPE